MSTVKVSIKNTFHYYGYPQLEDHYEIESDYFNGKVRRYGNQGFTIPEIKPINSRLNNGYFWTANAFMKKFYGSDELKDFCRGIKEGETKSFSLEY